MARGKSAPDLNGADNSSDNESKLADGCNNGDSVDGLYIKRTEPHKYELSGFNFIAISDKLKTWEDWECSDVSLVFSNVYLHSVMYEDSVKFFLCKWTRVISLWVWISILRIVNINCMHCWFLLLPCVWRGFI